MTPMRRLPSRLDTFELLRLAPSAGVLVVWGVLMNVSGGFRPGTWLPAGLLLAGLLALAITGGRRVLPEPGPARLALLCLIGLTAWSFLSLLWSDAPALTWEAADLLLVALLGAWTLALAPWRATTATGLLLAFSGLAGLSCLIALLSATSATDLTDRFTDGRFMPPLDYPNATAAFGFMAAIPALLYAARPGGHPVAKGLSQGLAVFLGAYALLPQSRGSILGGLATLLILAVMVPFRWRMTLHSAVFALALIAVSGAAGDLYTAAFVRRHASNAVDVAAREIVIAALVSIVAGAVLAAAADSFEIGRRAGRRARRAGLALTALCVLALGAVGVANSSTISNELSDQWRSLRHPGVDYAGNVANQASGRLSSIDPLERYDYWRVSLDGFKNAPLWGMGAGGFEYHYTLERRYPKVARYPHNLVMKVAGDLGLVGLLLAGGFVVVAGAGLVPRRGRFHSPEAAVAAAGLATLGYFVAHGFFDWLEAYPVLAGPALAFPLVALAVRGRAERLAALEEGTAEVRKPDARHFAPDPRRRGLAIGTAVLAGLLVAYALGAPWLALRYRQRAAEEWRTAPGAAYADLRKAGSLNPLSAEGYVLEGVIALTRGDLATARTGFDDALARQSDWLPHFGLAVVAAARGDRAEAAAQLATARRLNRLDPNLPQLSRRLLSGRKVDPAQAIHDVLVSPLFESNRVT